MLTQKGNGKMKEKLAKIREAALAQINADDADPEQIKIRYLGKKGELTAVLRGTLVSG